MIKKLALLLALIVVLLAAAYLGVSYKLCDQLSTVSNCSGMPAPDTCLM
jgi:hypothetical protein